MDTTTEAKPMTDLYWEATGSGPAVLLIAGTPGDGGQFAGVAQALAVDHLVITYDRCGTSRSVPPAGWSVTTVAEQADDAAAVLAAVGVPSAAVFGTSNGALVALELALCHPARVQRAIIHEAPLLSVIADPTPVASALGSLIGGAMERGGPTAALDAFLRFAYGDGVVDGWTPELRARLLASAETVFSVEMPAFQAYRPDEGRLAASDVPVTILVGENQDFPLFHEAAGWLADRVGTAVHTAPDAHAAHFTAPDRLAATIRRFGEG